MARTYAPDGGYGWVVVAASFICHGLSLGLAYSFGVLYMILMDVFHGNESETALIGSLQLALVNITGLFAPPILKKFGWRPVTIFGALLSSLGFISSTFTHRIEQLYITYGLIAGIGGGLMYTSSTVVVLYYFDKKRARATGIAVCGTGIGTMFFVALTRNLVGIISGRWTVRIYGLITLIGGVLCGLAFRPLPVKEDLEESLMSSGEEEINNQHRASLLSSDSLEESKRALLSPEPKKDRSASVLWEGNEIELNPLGIKENYDKYTKDIQNEIRSRSMNDIELDNLEDILPVGEAIDENDPNHNNITDNKTKEEKQKEKNNHCCKRLIDGISDTFLEIFDPQLLKNPMLIVLLLTQACYGFGYSIPFTFTPQRAQHLNIEPVYASSLISIMSLANTVGRIVFGAIGSRSPQVRFYLAGVVLVLAGNMSLLIGFFTTYSMVIVYSVLWGICSGAWMAYLPVLLIDFFGLDNIVRAFGFCTTAMGCVIVFSTPLAGLLIHNTHNYDLPFWIAGGIETIGGIVFFSLIYCVGRTHGYREI